MHQVSDDREVSAKISVTKFMKSGIILKSMEGTPFTGRTEAELFLALTLLFQK